MTVYDWIELVGFVLLVVGATAGGYWVGGWVPAIAFGSLVAGGLLVLAGNADGGGGS